MNSYPEVRHLLEDEDHIINNDGFTSLHKIILGSSPEALRAQLQLDDALLDMPDSHGWTPLQYAVFRNDLEAVKLLLEYGANPELAEQHRRTPLYFAALYGHLDCAKLLLERKASVTTRDWGLRQPLHVSSAYRHPESTRMADLLISYGANVHEKGYEDNTPLLTAASEDNPWMVDTLISYGADIEARDEDGQTPIISAIRWGGIKVIKLLLEKGARTDIVDNDGRNILHHAACFGNWHTLQLLMMADLRGVKPDATLLDVFDSQRPLRMLRPVDGVTNEQERQLFLSLIARAGSVTVEEIHDAGVVDKTADNEHGDAESDIFFEAEEPSSSSCTMDHSARQEIDL